MALVVLYTICPTWSALRLFYMEETDTLLPSALQWQLSLKKIIDVELPQKPTVQISIQILIGSAAGWKVW